MLSELMSRVKDLFRPYTFEDFVKDNDPKDVYEIEQLEKRWNWQTDPKSWRAY